MTDAPPAPESVPVFIGQTPSQAADFSARGIAGVVQVGAEKVEVPLEGVGTRLTDLANRLARKQQAQTGKSE